MCHHSWWQTIVVSLIGELGFARSAERVAEASTHCSRRTGIVPPVSEVFRRRRCFDVFLLILSSATPTSHGRAI